MSSNPVNSLDRITAAQLLPIAAPIVAAGTGARVAEVLPNLQESLGTVIVCYVLWGMAVPLAVLVLVIYYQRLAVHKLPPREVIVSCFLPLGPLGFGGFTIMYLGQVARTVFAVRIKPLFSARQKTQKICLRKAVQINNKIKFPAADLLYKMTNFVD